jgi:demethylmenaquinone methyltransferase/2-methoxy-6-polyprenyl-1,4-benzoquinol methylase
MFSRIAGRYDLLNRLLSFRRDVYWRKIALDLLSPEAGWSILDLCTGTADLTIAAAGRGVHRIVGIDLSLTMLRLGQKKIRRLQDRQRVYLLNGDVEDLPFPDGTFDGITIGFGIRNVVDVESGLREMVRVLKGGGKVAILEFSRPTVPIVRHLYFFYLRWILPHVGGLISGDREAYRYLQRTVMAFPDGERFMGMMKGAGLVDVEEQRLTLGVVTVYTGRKY